MSETIMEPELESQSDSGSESYSDSGSDSGSEAESESDDKGDIFIKACYKGDLEKMRKLAPEFDLNTYRNNSYSDNPSPLLAAIFTARDKNGKITFEPAKLLLELGARPSAYDLYKTNQFISMNELSFDFIPLLLTYQPDLNAPLRVNECGLDDHFLSEDEIDWNASEYDDTELESESESESEQSYAESDTLDGFNPVSGCIDGEKHFTETDISGEYETIPTSVNETSFEKEYDETDSETSEERKERQQMRNWIKWKREHPRTHRWKNTTPFKAALDYGNSHVIKAYMETGSTITTDEEFRSACQLEDIEFMELGIKNGVNPLAVYNGNTHLESICFNIKRFLPGACERIKWFLDHGATLTQRTPEEGPLLNYVLYQAYLRQFQTEGIKWFMENGAAETINWEDKYGDSPLSIAVASNNEGIVRCLLALGANPTSGKALQKAMGEANYHPESLALIRPHSENPLEPASDRIISLLRGESVDGEKKSDVVWLVFPVKK